MASPAEQLADPESTQEFHCPVCAFGPQSATETLVHIVTNYEIDA